MPKLSRNKLITIAFAVLFFVALPFLATSSNTKKIYVETSASGTQNGSSEHPFKTIKQAMKEADEKTEIHISKGTYEENVDMKKGVKIFGEDEDDVVIESDDKDEPTVFMRHKTTINKVTIKKGKYGVKVDDDAKASIVKCVVKDSRGAGIKIKGDGKHKDDMVSISKTVVKENDGPGIFVPEKRRISITESEIVENKGDGIDLGKNISAWIADSSIKNNKKSGMKLVIDGASIWTKSNSIRNNNREGVEVSWYGGAGKINIAKSKFFKNERFAVARVQRGYFNSGLRGQYLTFDDKNVFGENIFGDISKIFVIK